MKKVTKDVASPLVVSAWKACSGLPLATPEQVKACVGFYHANNPRPPMVPADMLAGNAGSGAAAQNAVLLALVGFRVPYRVLVAHLNTFTSESGKLCGNNVDNHTKDITTVKVDSVGGVDWIACSVGGTGGNKWIAANPEWYAARTGVAPTAVVPTVATASEEPAPATTTPSSTGKGLGKALRNKRKAVEATASPADIAAGKAARASKGK